MAEKKINIRRGLLNLLLDPNQSSVLIQNALKVQNLTLKQTRVSYTGDTGYNTDKHVYVSLPFIVSQNSLCNQSKAMLPVLTTDSKITINEPNMTFFLATTIPRKIEFSILSETAKPLTTIEYIQLVFEFEIFEDF